MRYGYKLWSEGFGPKELVRQAVLAEASGFDFVEISDHYHPWLDSQGHSPFAWTVLGAIAASDRLGRPRHRRDLPDGAVPRGDRRASRRDLAIVCDGRFTLGVGSGERLNEHVVGRGFPAVAERQGMLSEALEIIRLLWQGGYRSYRGEYLDLEDARVFDLPDELPVIAVAAAVRMPRSWPRARRRHVRHRAKAELFEAYRGAGGTDRPTVRSVWRGRETEEAAVQAAFESSRWSLTGWKVMSELPNPANFEAASSGGAAGGCRAAMPCGPGAASTSRRSASTNASATTTSCSRTADRTPTAHGSSRES